MAEKCRQRCLGHVYLSSKLGNFTIGPRISPFSNLAIVTPRSRDLFMRKNAYDWLRLVAGKATLTGTHVQIGATISEGFATTLQG